MFKKFYDGVMPKKVLIALVLVIAAVLSCTFAASWAMSPENHERTIASLDEKKDTAMALTASTTFASVAVSVLPDDIATPISDKLADLTQYFLIVLIVLYAEKYLLTVIGAASFLIMIPVACMAGIIYIFSKREWLKKLAVKLLVVAILLYGAIPASIKLSDMIYDTYSASINDTINEAEQLTNEAEDLAAKDQNIWEAISGAATNLKDKASHILTSFTEALAVMIVTACVIPLLVLIFFIWLMKTLLGVNIQSPKLLPSIGPKHGKAKDEIHEIEEK